MKRLLTTISLCFAVAACTMTTGSDGKKHLASTFSIEQRKALLATVTQLASAAAAAAGGGPAAAAGLNALGTVAQGFVGKIIPSAMVAASPGVTGVDRVAVASLSNSTPVTQADVNAIFDAAKQAATQTAK